MSITKRITKFLLIAALAFPAWNAASAQKPTAPPEKETAEVALATKPDKSKVLVTKLAGNRAVQQLDIYNGGTTTQERVPIYGWWLDAANHGQMIYPADSLTGIVGAKITSITFHASSAISSTSGSTDAPVTLKIGNTNQNNFSSSTSFIDVSSFTSSCTLSTIFNNAKDITFNFTTPFTYNGGNLLLDMSCEDVGSKYGRIYWISKSASGASLQQYSDYSPTQQNYLPYITITYQTTPTEPYVGSLSGNGAFGEVKKGTTKSTTITVLNGGTSAFTPQLVSSDPAFTVSGDMTTQLASDQSRDFTVTFSPTKVQEYSGTLTLSAPEGNGAISATLALSGKGTNNVTIGDESSSNDYAPVYGSYFDYGTATQMIYPSSMLSDLNGKKIKAIKFYSTSNLDEKLSSSTITVSVGEVSGTTVSQNVNDMNTNRNGLTPVYEGNITSGISTWTIEFDEPYEYHGGNLMIDNVVSSSGKYNSTSWYGVTAPSMSFGCYYNNYSGTTQSLINSDNTKFLPKITFELEAGVSVNKTALTFGDVQVNTTSAAQTVTVSNSGDEAADLSWSFTNGKFSTTATATSVPAGGQVEIPVTFTPTAVGAQTGTLIINADGKTFNVTLNGNGLLAYAATIDPQTVDFGAVAKYSSTTATVTLTNTGINAITPTFTQPGAPFSVTGDTGSLASGETRTYTITFAPTAQESYTSGFSIADADHNISFTVTLAGQGAPVNPLTATSPVDFGSVAANSSTTRTVTFTNPNNAPLEVTLATAAPYSIPESASPLTIAANGTASVTVTFSPTDAASHTGSLTATTEGVNTVVVLKGVGTISGVPAAIRDSAFFAGISYQWPINVTNPTNSSTLDQVATDPDQIIAMIREIYTNQDIPGNYKRGYSSTGGSEDYDDVYYGGIGTITRGSGYSSSSYYSYSDAYGWKIPGNVVYGTYSYFSSATAYYAHMNATQYKPYQEGLTMLLVEVNDSIQNVSIDTSITDNYQQLKEYISKTIKSVRVVTQAKRTGSGDQAGTLFNIDCNKMNKFYLMAKGQMRWFDNSDRASFVYNGTTYKFGEHVCDEPCYLYSRYNSQTVMDQYNDEFVREPFYHMFEQFSPTTSTQGDQSADLYAKLIKMESFPVIHDCMSVAPVMGHQFQLYGIDSGSDDCQDVRDLMFFVPDKRMQYYCIQGTDTTYCRDEYYNDQVDNTQKFRNYNINIPPMMGLFVIKQNKITGEQISVEGAPTYKLHLTWTSNLLDFLPGEDGMYTLYRVVTNANGIKTYEAVGEFDPNTFEYYDNIPMQLNGQQVTYVVQGQDVGKFLSLQMSNEESFIIPGLDHAEQLRINLNSDYYFSRYDAAEQRNYYSNSLIANNTVGTNVKPNYIKNDSEFKFWRATLKTVDGQTVVDTENAVNFVTAKVENYSTTVVNNILTGGGNLRYVNWVDQADFSTKPYKHGYHQNPETSNITLSSGEVEFDGLKLYDNFCVSVEENTHPAQYVYYVTLETAVPFGLDQDLPSCAAWQDGKIFAYFEAPYDDWYEVRAYAWNGDDLFAGQWAGTEMTEVGIHNNNKVYQWSIDARQNGALPASIIFSYKDGLNEFHQTQNLDFTNGGYYTIVNVSNHQGGLVKVVSADNTSNQARSNTISVPVYKTAMTMVPITAADVEADMTHSKPASTQFTLNARYSSKSEILGYYIYRWADNDPEQPRTIYETNGDDSSPQGQAGNQGDHYTVAMNTDYTSQTANFNANYDDVTATFMDNFMVNDADDADTYTYAPVVELFAPETAVELPSGDDREDYNTYGGPQQMTAGGIVDVQVVKNAMSDYSWTANGKTYRYYNVYLFVDALDLPDDYQIAKVRAWRKIDSQYLGEEEDKGYMSRLDLDANGEYVFVNKSECQKNDLLGGESITSTIKTGTFGALDVKTNGSIPMKFMVRVYFTKNSSSKADGDQPYYIMETEIEDNLTDDIPVGINGVEVNRDVVSVKYYNVAGVESDQPFDGVNMVVTRYTDGTVTTSKVMK